MYVLLWWLIYKCQDRLGNDIFFFAFFPVLSPNVIGELSISPFSSVTFFLHIFVFKCAFLGTLISRTS